MLPKYTPVDSNQNTILPKFKIVFYQNPTKLFKHVLFCKDNHLRAQIVVRVGFAEDPLDDDVE